MYMRFASRVLTVASLFALPGLASAAPQNAHTASTTLAVTAQVQQTCTISTVGDGLAFGIYDPVVANVSTALNTTGQISVTCTKAGALSGARSAAAMTLGIDNGVNVAGIQRQMKGLAQGGFLPYDVYQPPNATPNTPCTYSGTRWTNVVGAGELTLTAAPNKLARVYNVCGTVAPGLDVPVDTYNDTLNATLNF